MDDIRFRNFRPEDAQLMADLQGRYVEACPDTGKFEPGFWLSPSFANGKNIIIAENSQGQILGYAATHSAYYSNALEARIFWIDLRSDPVLDPNLAIKDALLERIIQRGREFKLEEQRKRAAMGATYFAQGRASIEYLEARGFQHFETMLAMKRGLSDFAAPQFHVIDGIEIKAWWMESQAEKIAYLAARELAFGYPLGRLDLLEHFTHSELWQGGTPQRSGGGGTTFTAFAEGQIIGSVMALSNGLLDYVFVIPAWRGKGIAKGLLSKALAYLKERDHPQAWLEVYAHNEVAIHLYQSFGFKTFKEEISLGYLLD